MTSLGNVHAAGGVHARRDAKGNSVRGQVDAAESAPFEQSTQPGVDRLRKPFKPSLAKTRLSPMSGTASAMVAMATIFMERQQ